MSFKSLTILAALVAAAAAAPTTAAPCDAITSCGDCVSNGFVWNQATNECVKKGSGSVDCVHDIVQCPVTPGEGPVRPVMPVLPSKPACTDNKCETVVPTPAPTEPCETIIPTPTLSAEPCETETATATATGVPESTSAKVCKNVPSGFCGGYVYANVAYSVPAMYGCVNKCENMTMWCEVDEKSNEKFFYCCGDKCSTIPAPKTCEVDGTKYTVGVAYDITLKGEKVTMWCTSEDEYTTCKGQECGCSQELTPPGLAVCPKPPTTIPAPHPPKPIPSPHPPKPCLCGKCMSLGMSWNSATNECVKKGCKSVDCVNSLDQCPVTPGEGPFPDTGFVLPGTCGECLKGGMSWNKAIKKCVKFESESGDCVTDILHCPVSHGEGPSADTAFENIHAL